MDWKTQHSKDAYFPQTDSFNSIPIKILTRLLFWKNGQDYSKMYMER